VDNTKKSTSQVVSNLEKFSQSILELTHSKVFAEFPEIEKKYGRDGVERTKEDSGFHFSYLKTAVQFENMGLFLDYVGWLKMFFASINLPTEFILKSITLLNEAAQEVLSKEDSDIVDEFVQYALDNFDSLPTKTNSFLSDKNELNVIAQQYLNLLLRKDRQSAEKLISSALESGTNIKDIYLFVFQPVQYEVGHLWQQNKISVAMEHYCTAATQFIMTRLYEYVFSSEKNGRNMVATSVSGELHEIGIRMVADFFEIEGWNTVYLGSNTPHSSIISMLKETKADLLAISSTIPFNVPQAQSLITRIKNETELSNLKIIVGGRPFNTNKELWKQVGADGFANNAQNAIAEAERLLQIK